jgi:hypothetical protein
MSPTQRDIATDFNKATFIDKTKSGELSITL